ncbi:MAG: SDR family NAD(P)-dependent oxidoreductase [Ignavibacteria bacterium]|nr:SDR family NAD(P)-dependent oxidoreductase [Ignavibacteria bacterium]
MNPKEVTIITGASKGIGESIAYKFASEDHHVVLIGRNEERLKIVSKKINQTGTSEYYVGSVTDPNFIKNSLTEVIEKHGKIDHLINNAGIMIIKRFEEATLEEFQSQMETNMYGVFICTKEVLPTLIERKSGSIINISSLAGKNNFVGGTMYSTTKHALMGFTKSLMLEVRDHNIRVAVVCPGSVATDLLLNSPITPQNKGKILQPDDVAEVVFSIIKLPPRALVSEIEIRPTNPI